MILQFGEYLPDLPSFQNQGMTVAKNVIPSDGGYLQFPAQTTYSNALTARCQGAISTKNNSGATNNFAGDATKLYKSSGGVYADVSLAGGYTITAEDNWHFTRFGDRLIATDFSDYPQTYNLTSSTNFANLTTAVKARYCATIRNFLFLGNTNDSVDGIVPHRVRWSALNDPTDFTVSATTQSDYQDLDPTNGWVRAIISGEYGVIFQERAIVRATYQGSPTVFQFDVVETGRGTKSPYSVIKVGNLIYYYDFESGGFYVFDGNQSTPIGENKVNRTFRADLDANYLTRIYAAVDPAKQVIYWAYPASGNTSGRANKIISYNYSPTATTRWAYCDGLDLELIYTSLSEGYTLEQLDAVSSNLDALAFSLDSLVWTGQNTILSGFDSSHKQANFTGTALTALLETGEFQVSPGKRSNIMRIRPIVDGTSATVTLQLGTRNNLTEAVTWGSAISTDGIGEFQVRSNARYHRARLNISGGFNFAQGLEALEFTSGGSR